MFSLLQPVGFVTFDNRAGAEAAKNSLNVSTSLLRDHSFLDPLFSNKLENLSDERAGKPAAVWRVLIRG